MATKNNDNDTKSLVIGAVAAAVALFSLTLVDEHVLGKVDNVNCVAAPLAATAAMMFSSPGAPDAKSIVGYVRYESIR